MSRLSEASRSERVSAQRSFAIPTYLGSEERRAPNVFPFGPLDGTPQDVNVYLQNGP